MSAVTRQVRNLTLPLFLILAFLFGWILFIAAALGADVSPDGMPIGPIAAATIAALVAGRSELRIWWRQLVTFRTSFGCYALAIAAPVVIIVAAVLANSAFGAPLPARTQLAGWTALPGGFALTLLLVGIGEEAGWTAFAARRLLARHSFLTAWVILAAIRVLWHLPLMMSGQLPWVLGVGGNIAFQFLVTWLFVRAGGVWFLAALWHAVLNTTGGQFFFQMVQGQDQQRLGVLMTLGYVIVAVTVLLVDYRRIAERRLAPQAA
jgi:membrane protease YdiL (CAAX protease family)